MLTTEIGVMSESSSENPVAILLVDDDRPFRDRLATAFADRGFAVETAGDYDEAMERARGCCPKRAVVDLRMPGRSGLELVRDLKRLDPAVEVLVLSGFGSISSAVDAVRLGATNFLPKPADVDDILTAFERGHTEASIETENPTEVPSLVRRNGSTSIAFCPNATATCR